MTFALIPAAGHSSRMGQPKLILPLGSRTVLEWVIEAIRDGGCARILVVVGPHVPELVPLAERAGAITLTLPNPTRDMRATIEAGLNWVEESLPPEERESWLLVPADHPALHADIVRGLLQHTSDSIHIPTFQGKRGHPVRLRWQDVAGIRALPPHQGVNSYLRLPTTRCSEWPVVVPDILFDLDTPADYQRLAAAFSKR